jgi:hypothetical protein
LVEGGQHVLHVGVGNGARFVYDGNLRHRDLLRFEASLNKARPSAANGGKRNKIR